MLEGVVHSSIRRISIAKSPLAAQVTTHYCIEASGVEERIVETALGDDKESSQFGQSPIHRYAELRDVSF